MSRNEFLEEIAGYICEYAPKYDIFCPSAVIAQAILESGWGESTLAAKYHNYFGMKCGTLWQGKSVNMKTQEEYTPGELTTITDNFRVYDSMEDGVIGYFEFIQMPRYRNLKGIKDPAEYLETISADGYATSSAYAENCMRVVTENNLTKYDQMDSNQGVYAVRRKAVDWMVDLCEDDSHGYDQIYRWGEKGDKGDKGDDGDDYILTAADKEEIAGMIDVPSEIDDTAGDGDTDKTWSADKISSELEGAGSVKDVTINGSSIVDNETGIAEVPISYGQSLGVVTTNGNYGTMTNVLGMIYLYGAQDADIKAGNHSYRPITPVKQHQSTFYGLAKSAGDTTQSASSNAVGTYTEDAKLAIRNMIDATGESATITVSGTAPVIQASRNARYMCGEVLSLDFTPCASGICEVIFTSGSSATVLTLPQTVKMPEWFEVEADHVYDISIIDGVYGAVMVW